MEEILNNLEVGEIVHITIHGTFYLFLGQDNILGVIYSINNERKTLPLNTINFAYNEFNNGVEINAQWYNNYNHHEYQTRGCNLPVLNNLLARL